jgi:hypothetical protein
MNRRSFLSSLVAVAAAPLLPSRVTPDNSSIWLASWDVGGGPYKLGPANLERLAPAHVTTIRTQLPATYWRALNEHPLPQMMANRRESLLINPLLEDLKWKEL